MNMRSWRTTLALSFVTLLGPVTLLAQTQFASFTGTVTSKDGNPLPKVEVVATNQATQVTYTARSNDASGSGMMAPKIQWIRNGSAAPIARPGSAPRQASTSAWVR